NPGRLKIAGTGVSSRGFRFVVQPLVRVNHAHDVIRASGIEPHCFLRRCVRFVVFAKCGVDEPEHVLWLVFAREGPRPQLVRSARSVQISGNHVLNYPTYLAESLPRATVKPPATIN